MFKRFLAMAIMAGMVVTPVNAAEEAQIVNVNNIRSEVAVITEVNEDVFTFVTLNDNNLWDYEKSGYEPGQIVSVVFDTKGTEALEDDEILIDPVVSGMVEGETSENRLKWFKYSYTFFLSGEDY